jgi:hypothetical protein
VVPVICNVLTAPHIQDSIYSWTNLRHYWRYIDNSMCVILQTWCQYSVQPPDYAMWTVAPDIYNVNTVPHVLASVFKWTYLRWYWRYVQMSMGLIPQTLCQMLRISSSLSYVNCGPGHIQCIYSSTYSGFNIQMNVSALILEICRQFNRPYTANFVPIQRTSCSLHNVNCGSGHMQCIYRSAYSYFNAHLNVSALQL